MTRDNIGKRPRSIWAKSLLVSLAMASLAWGQGAPRLEIAVSPSGQVKIFARAVSYGEVLRALQDKLGVAIEIPKQADELKLDYACIEASPPDEALKKLLEGSRLGYAWLAGSHRLEKVVILAPRAQQASESTLSPPDTTLYPLQARSPDAVDIASSPIEAEKGVVEDPGSLRVPPAQVWPLTEAGIVNGTESSLAAPGPSTMPLSEAVNAIGVPPGVSPADVGRTMTFPVSDAASIMGVPPGVSPGDVGRTTTTPLPTNRGKHP
jgi:hypothetical protein